jgi:hypothetical protein
LNGGRSPHQAGQSAIKLKDGLRHAERLGRHESLRFIEITEGIRADADGVMPPISMARVLQDLAPNCKGLVV